MILGIFSFFPTMAQDKSETVYRYFQVYRVWKPFGDSAYVSIYANENYGLSVLASGPVTAAYNFQSPRSEAELGTAIVNNKVEDKPVYIVLVINNHPLRADSNYIVRVGDLIRLPVKAQPTRDPSLFRRIDLLGINLFDHDNQIVYTSDILLNRNNKSFEDSLLEVYAADMRKGAGEWKDSSNKKVFTPLEKGRFKGKTLHQVWLQVTGRDVYHFLQYVYDFNKGYYGKDIILQNYLLGWVLDGAPMGAQEILDSMTRLAGNPAAYNQLINDQKDYIIKEEVYQAWFTAALDLKNRNYKEKALALFDVMAPAFRIMNNKMASGTYYIAKAQVCEEMEKYKQAVTLCDSGIVYLRNTTDRDKIYYQINYKKASLLRLLKEKEKSLAVSDQLLQYVAKDTLLHDSASIFFIRGRIFKEKGKTYETFENYPEAVQHFRMAIGEFNKINSNTGRLHAGDSYELLARVFEKQQRYPEAEKIYRELKDNYLAQSDLDQGIRTVSKIAYTQSKQGDHSRAIINYSLVVRYFTAAENWELAGYNLSQVGQCYWSLGKYDSAIYSHNKALELQHRAGNDEYKAYAWGKLGSLYSVAGDPGKAFFACDSALYYADKGKDTIAYIGYLNDKGDVYNTSEDINRASETYLEAAGLSRKIKNKSGLMNSVYNLARLLHASDTSTARKNYLDASRLADELGDKEKQIFTKLNLGLLQVRQQKYKAAQPYFNAARATALKDQNLFNLGECYNYLGDAANTQLNYDSAHFFYTRAYRLFDSSSNKQKLTELSGKLGNFHINLSEYDEAMVWFNRGLVLADSTNNNPEKSNLLLNRSYLYLIKGNNKSAKQDLDSIESLLQQSKNPFLLAGLYISYGNYYWRFFELEKSLAYYKSADSIYAVEGSPSGRITCLNNIGNLYLSQRDNDNALLYFSDALKIAEKAGVVTDDVLLLKLNASQAWFNKKNYAKATLLATECEKIAAKTGAFRRKMDAIEMKGMIAFKQKNYPSARASLQEVIRMRRALNDSIGSSSAELYLLRIAKEEKKYAEALQLAQTVQRANETAEDENALWEVLYEKGNVYLLLDQYDSAIVNYKKAIVIVTRLTVRMIGTEEEKDKLKSEETRTDLFNQLISACYKAKLIDEAVYYTNLANLQGIKEKTQGAGNDQAPAAEIEKGKEILQRKNTAKETIDKEKAKPTDQQNADLLNSMLSIYKTAEEDYANYIDDLATKYESIKTSFAESVNPKVFESYKQQIPDSVACLLYAVNKKQVYIFIVTNTETRAVTIEPSFSIDTAINTLQKALRVSHSNFSSTALVERGGNTKSRDTKPPKVTDYFNTSKQLYDVLIKPVADMINGKKTLCIIPTGRLTLIPFQVLAYKTDTVSHFLIEDFEIFYTSQMEVFFNKGIIKKDFDKLTAFGNPDNSLASAETEITNLRELFKNAQYFVSDSATELRARESLVRDKYVHFATHGILDYNDFRNSYLVFAHSDSKDSAKDGRLTIREIKRLLIKDCDLVTLSACETGVNKEISKGWYISPANSFLVKGVRSVVASLWKVNDAATSVLMTEFYTNLQTMGKAAALRKAQITLTQDPAFQHPYYWAPFLLYGDWR